MVPNSLILTKKIPAKTCYKTHDGELLAIVKAFKIWWHCLEGCKHKVLMLTDHNNFCSFMDIKSLSSRQVCWAQKPSKYHFWIDYCQNKANGPANALSCFFQRSNNKEKKLQADNSQIFHWLQFLPINTSWSRLNVMFSSVSPLY